MMRQLFRNTIISGGSLFLTSLMLLLVSPLIVRHWGLTEYGLVGLSRTFLLGFSGSLDLGVAEIVTMSIARARQNDNWSMASSHLSLALWINCVVGAAFANAPYTVVVYIAIGTIVFTNAIKALIAWRIGSRLGLKLTTVVP